MWFSCKFTLNQSIAWGLTGIKRYQNSHKNSEWNLKCQAFCVRSIRGPAFLMELKYDFSWYSKWWIGELLGMVYHAFSLRLAIRWNDGVATTVSFAKPFFCSGKGVAQKFCTPNILVFQKIVLFDTPQKSEYSSSCGAPHHWLTQPLFGFKPRQSWRVSLVFPASVARWKTSKDQCSYEAVHMAGPKRFLLHAANHETDLTGLVKLSKHWDNWISHHYMSFDNLQNTPWFENTSWMNQ